MTVISTIQLDHADWVFVSPSPNPLPLVKKKKQSKPTFTLVDTTMVTKSYVLPLIGQNICHFFLYIFVMKVNSVVTTKNIRSRYYFVSNKHKQCDISFRLD